MNTISVLNGLIETLKDGEQGFRAASEDVESPELKTVLSEYSFQRSRFVGELQALARSYGESEPPEHGSVPGAVHRGWLNLRSAMATREEHAVLAECERGEDYATAQYLQALEESELPPSVLDAVRAQYVAIKAAHDHVRGLRDGVVLT